ncbi:MAG: tRNA (N(6)-L-threonylcarbamoyladenosine(37)-C(2))-methylthiotransferase MtaB [Lachnospiraceae bacterium]
MYNVSLHNLGCKVNAYEIEVMQQNLQENGYKIVPFAPGADIYIINTCTVTNIADRKSRQMLHKAKKMNPESIVVAVGCYVQTGKEEIELDDCIDLAIGNNRKKDLVAIIEEYLSSENRKDKMLSNSTILDINDKEVIEYEEMTLKQSGEHTRAHVKIQDGCNQFCSYCIIPFARGRVRSRKSEDIIREVKGLVASGYKEIIITGIHISSYGIDFVSQNSEDYLTCEKDEKFLAHKNKYLINVIKNIHDIEGLERIRIGSLEPRIITREFIEELHSLEKLCPHFHLSLQSGCDDTLKRMNRHYTIKEYKEKIQLIREIYKKPAITTDIIVGFPGETQEEFLTSYENIKEISFAETHVFKYSKREGTKAAQMKEQVNDTEKTLRSKALIELNEVKSLEYKESFVGQTVIALIEEEKEILGEKYKVGYTDAYLKIATKNEEISINKMYKGIVKSILNNLYLELE